MRIRHLLALIALVCATLLSSHPALAQFSQQGPKLVETGVVGLANYQSISVSLRTDTFPMTLKWIAERLSMGTWTNIANCLAKGKKTVKRRDPFPKI